MTPRSLNCLEAVGSARIDLITDPPCLPVAPMMTRSLDIVVWIYVVSSMGSELKWLGSPGVSDVGSEWENESRGAN